MRTTARKRKQKLHNRYCIAMVIAAVLFCVAVVMLILSLFGVFSRKDAGHQGGFMNQLELRQDDPENLGYGLQLEAVGRYAGLYLEDGSNDPVSDVMMIRIKNTGDKDLQLARLSLIYSDYSAEFEITNLPVGRSVVVLEKTRKACPSQDYLSFTLNNVVYFPNPMDVRSETYEITGMKGAINLKNRSAGDVSGDIYVYYKYTSDDMLYGGITFRAKITGGIPSGQTKQVISQHFDPEQCIILAITDGV